VCAPAYMCTCSLNCKFTKNSSVQECVCVWMCSPQLYHITIQISWQCWRLWQCSQEPPAT